MILPLEILLVRLRYSTAKLRNLHQSAGSMKDHRKVCVEQYYEKTTRPHRFHVR